MSGWKVTYVGQGVKPLGDFGVFARGTTATITEEAAKSLQNDKDWQVTSPGETPKAAPAAPAAPEAPAAPAAAPAKEEPKAEAPKAEPKKDDAPKADAKKEDAKKDDAKADAKKGDDKKPGKGGKKK